MSPEVRGCRDLCDRVYALTEQRLSCDLKKRPRASMLRSRPQSPKNIGAVHAARATMGQAETSPDTRVLPIEGRVMYMKLQGDQMLHLAETLYSNDGASNIEFGRAAAEALELYLAAQRVTLNSNESSRSNDAQENIRKEIGSSSSFSLPELHPLRLELALKISSVLLHMLDRPVEAWEAAHPVYLAAAERPARLRPRGLAIAELLRDHLTAIDAYMGQKQYHRDGTDVCTSVGCGLGEAADAWCFLRVSDGFDGGAPIADASARLRAVAQVKRARVAMTGFAKVLLDTMEEGPKIIAALRRVFSAYAKKYAVTPEKSDNTQKLESTHGRGEPLQLQTSSRFGPCLSWTGFEGLCSDFQIAAVTTIASTVSTSADAVTVVPAARTAYPLSRSSSHRAVEPLAPLSLANGRGYWSPMEGYAISAVQTRVAFLSACTHNSVVASFADGKGVALRAENGFSRPEGGGSRGESDDEEAYWLGVEKVLLSSSVPNTTGLDFGKFVDAVARCGAMRCHASTFGFMTCEGSTSQAEGGVEGAGIATGPTAGVKSTGNQGAMRILSRVAKGIQDIFVDQMRLLDASHVEAIALRVEEGTPQDESGRARPNEVSKTARPLRTPRPTSGKMGNPAVPRPQSGTKNGKRK